MVKSELNDLVGKCKTINGIPLTAKKIAELVGVSPSTISRWQRKQSPDIPYRIMDKIRDLAKNPIKS